MATINNIEEIRIQYDEMESLFNKILAEHGFQEGKAKTCAEIFANNSLDGVFTHSVNRFARFVRHIDNKYIDINAKPELIGGNNALEQWNGNLGAGPLNALFCTERSMDLAKHFGIGCVSLANTNHWMRGGTNGWKAAKNSFAFIGWTNTIPIMPAWGSIESKLGNNPFVLAVPYGSEAIVLDMAMSQFSYGIMEKYKMKNENLPFEGGFNSKGELTKDPSEILESMRPLPIGYWKGAGMALLLDIFATILSGGLPTYQLGKHKDEYGLSQVFISIDISKLKNFPSIQSAIDSIIQDYLTSIPENDTSQILYPGQRVLRTREENKQLGIPVMKSVWDEIINL